MTRSNDVRSTGVHIWRQVLENGRAAEDCRRKCFGSVGGFSNFSILCGHYWWKLLVCFKTFIYCEQLCNNAVNEEPEELIWYAALIHNSVMTSTEQWETSCLVNDAFGTTSWLFQDVSDVTIIVFHRVSATFCVSFHAGSSLPKYPCKPGLMVTSVTMGDTQKLSQKFKIVRTSRHDYSLESPVNEPILMYH
jgi:hypothetical protein